MKSKKRKNKRQKNIELIKKSDIAKSKFSKVICPELAQLKKDLLKNKNKALYEYQESFDYYYSLNTVEGQWHAWALNIVLQTALSESIKHFFIENKDLSIFFENTSINLKESELISIFNDLGLRNYNNKNVDDKFLNDDQIAYKENDENYVGIFFIHTKHKKRSEIVHVSFLEGNDVEYPLWITVFDGQVSSKFEMSDKFLFELNTENQSNGNLRNEDFKRIKFAINCIIYQHTFPEYIVDGPPHEIIEENSNTIKISDQIRSYIHSSRDVSPHLRRGHFRYLSSDRFKNKKGQTIFVSPSFVKGNAKTVKDGGRW